MTRLGWLEQDKIIRSGIHLQVHAARFSLASGGVSDMRACALPLGHRRFFKMRHYITASMCSDWTDLSPVRRSPEVTFVHQSPQLVSPVTIIVASRQVLLLVITGQDIDGKKIAPPPGLSALAPFDSARPVDKSTSHKSRLRPARALSPDITRDLGDTPGRLSTHPGGPAQPGACADTGSENEQSSRRQAVKQPTHWLNLRHAQVRVLSTSTRARLETGFIARLSLVGFRASPDYLLPPSSSTSLRWSSSSWDSSVFIFSSLYL
ncbi:hypothetical protein RRG08_045713 [Elysia crispata]|uniref:Uncharacterized protein n=1 Tax=Elysia crispata TaxID=231223 RepID=A0AAE0Z3K2_9GAST|nr:hypothetical protein RRG08_045713 [Elysia crispata]